MKGFSIALCLALVVSTSCAIAKELSDEETAQLAIIKAGKLGLFTGQIKRLNNKEISIYDDNSEVAVSPGRYSVTLGRFPLSNTASVTCITEAGHAYKANEDSCVDLGLSEGSKRYFDTQEKKQGESLQAKYAEYKILLQTPQPYEKLEEIYRDFDAPKGIFSQDPEKLRAQVELQIQPYYEKKKLDQARHQALVDEANAKYEKRMQLEEATRKQSEQKQLASFRKSLDEGDSTNCGLVIEKKAKLVKVQLKSNGTEQWLKIDEIFLPDHTCDVGDTNSAASVKNGFRAGQKVCKTITDVTLSAPTEYIVMGSRQYKENKGRNEVVGFVEGSSGENIQIRISGITFVNNMDARLAASYGGERAGVISQKSVDQMSGYNGVDIRVGQITWDKASSGWSVCN